MSTTARAVTALDRTMIGALIRRLDRWPGVLVFSYHRVGQAAASPLHRDGFVEAADLDAQLRVLAEQADVVTPQDVQRSAHTRIARGGRQVLITFDDGYRDNYDIAFPLLKAHGLSATFFLATALLDRPRVAWWDEIAWMVRSTAPRDEPPATTQQRIRDLVTRYQQLPGGEAEDLLEELAERTGAGRAPRSLADKLWMTWDQAREMQQSGMVFGGHTASHPVLARQSPARQRQEVESCAQALRRELDIPMRWFAYPVGLADCFDESTRRVVREAGVELAFSDYGGMSSFMLWDRFDVRRANPVAPDDGRWMRAALTLPRLVARW